MRLFGIDYETFWGQEYTLSKLTTEAYVRDPRFQTIGVAVTEPLLGRRAWLEHEQFRAFIEALRRSGEPVAFLAHHAHFDGFITSYHYGFAPVFWYDTLSIANAVHGPGVAKSLEKLCELYGIGHKGKEVHTYRGKRREDFTDWEWQDYGRYSLNDADLTWKLFGKLYAAFPASCRQEELELMDAQIRCFTEPELILDVPRMTEYLQWERARKAELLARTGEDASIFKSNDKFAELLLDYGIEPEMKLSPAALKKGETKWTYAFAKSDSFMKGLLEHDDVDVRTLAECRIGLKSTINETRTERYLGMASRGPLPVYYRYAAAHTYRNGGGDKSNWTNHERTNKKNPRKGTIRKSTQAPPGKALVKLDSSQIEARTLAGLAGEQWLIDAFAAGRDIYSEFATDVFNRPVDRKARPEDELPGFVGKVCIAEGQLVLTDAGLIPIESVRIEHRVWDGVEWVPHTGVVYQGVKDVITVEGLTATPDHEVWTADGRKVQLGSYEGPLGEAAPLAVGEVDGAPVRFCEGDRPGRAYSRRPDGSLPVHWMWGREAHQRSEPDERQEQRLPELLADAIEAHGDSWAALRRDTSAMQGSEEPSLARLWRSRGRVPIQESQGVCFVGRAAPTAQGLPRYGDRPTGQRRALRAWEPATGFSIGADVEPSVHAARVVRRGEEGPDSRRLSSSPHNRPRGPIRGEHSAATGSRGAVDRADHNEVLQRSQRQAKRVYDITNAGPRRRFTVSGVIVSNCILGLGFQMGWPKLAMTFLAGALGGEPVQFDLAMLEQMQIDPSRFLNNPKKVERAQIPCRLDTNARLIHCMVSEEIVKRYRGKNKRIEAFWGTAEEILQMMVSCPEGHEMPLALPIPLSVVYHGIKLPNGMVLRYPGLECRNGTFEFTGGDSGRQREHTYGGKFTENIVQALARIIVMYQILAIRRKYGYKLVLTTYDEGVMLVDEANAPLAYQQCLKEFQTPPWWAPWLPIAAEGGFGKVYGEIK